MTDLARSPEQLGNSIRLARKKTGLSQSALAHKTGLRQATISQIEKGHSAAKLETILNILAALNLELKIDNRSSFNPYDIAAKIIKE